MGVAHVFPQLANSWSVLEYYLQTQPNYLRYCLASVSGQTQRSGARI